MNISTRYIGEKIVEITVDTYETKIVTDITNLQGKADENFIQKLRIVANELEEHNKKLFPDDQS